jgi:hypothetical protein
VSVGREKLETWLAESPVALRELVDHLDKAAPYLPAESAECMFRVAQLALALEDLKKSIVAMGRAGNVVLASLQPHGEN